MRAEVAAGAIVYSPKRNKFLLVKHRDGHWEFPKGKQEGDESLTQTLVREVKEETGLTGRLLPFRTCSSYSFYRKGKVQKTVEYGVLLADGKPMISEEHLDLMWAKQEDVLGLLKFSEHKKLFAQAVRVLENESLLG